MQSEWGLVVPSREQRSRICLKSPNSFLDNSEEVYTAIRRVRSSIV